MGIIAGTILTAIGIFIYNTVTESKIRKYQKKLKTAKNSYYNELRTISFKEKSLKNKRLDLEIERRKALRIYYKAQLKLLTACQKILHETKQDGYDNLKLIQKNVISNKKYFYKEDIYSNFDSNMKNLFSKISTIKTLEQYLVSTIRIVRERKNSIPWEKKNVGSKKKIIEISDYNLKSLQEQFKGKNAQEKLEYNNYAFDLLLECPDCKVGISENMSFCYSCGIEFEQTQPLTFYKKYIVDEDFVCTECNAPLNENFTYCYNCGSINDPFGFVELSK